MWVGLLGRVVAVGLLGIVGIIGKCGMLEFWTLHLRKEWGEKKLDEV